MILQVLAAPIFFAKFTHFITVNQNMINFTEKDTETAVNKAIFDFGTSTLGRAGERGEAVGYKVRGPVMFLGTRRGARLS